MERERPAEDLRSPAELQAAEVRAYLETLLASPIFSNSARRAKLLRYLVEHSLAGDGDRLNEYAIGVDVFGKPASFDPRLESVVRTELSRLGQKLKDHYKKDGLADRIQIEFPQRSYVPVFRVPEAARPPAATVRPIRRWWIAVAVAALAVVVGAIWALRSRRDHPTNSIAVLPFVNLSPDHRDDYLADGITEELTNDLAQSRDLRVVARTSAWVFKGKAVDIREIGRRLNAENALEGSFERDGDRVRITAQLNRTADGYHVWSHSYEVPPQELMTVQQQAAQSVITALHGGQKAAAVISMDSTRDPAAHDLYLRAYELALHRSDSYRQSLALFEQAIRADPSYVNAYIGIARVHIALIHLTQEPPEQGIPAARAALEKALALDPSCGEARGILADIIAIYDWNWPVAEREFRRALQDGAQSTTYSFYGSLLATRGRFREAQAELRIAEDLDPLGMGPRFNQFMAFGMERNYSAAKRVLLGMLEMNPEQWDAHYMLGVLACIERKLQ